MSSQVEGPYVEGQIEATEELAREEAAKVPTRSAPRMMEASQRSSCSFFISARMTGSDSIRAA